MGVLKVFDGTSWVAIGGPSGGSSTLTKEPAVESPDGVNMIFTTSSVYITGSLTVYLNGLRERYITELGTNQFTFTQAPRIGFLIDVEYVV
jgi:hypothetical protein